MGPAEELPFEDRTEAGRLLGSELGALRSLTPLVLGIPRGGLIVAHAIAAVLGAELDAVFTLNLLSPGHPGFALGAVAEGGKAFIDDELAGRLGLDGFLKEEMERRRAELSRTSSLIRKLRPRIPPAGRNVIVVDDGLFTGSTMKSALRMVREDGPRRLVAAIPVGLEGAVERAASLADDLVCLRCPPDFIAVSQFYRKFPPITDGELRLLFQA